MNAGMGSAAFGDLAGAVAASGGVGVIGTSSMTHVGLQNEIDNAREWSDGPLAVDIVFPTKAPSGRAVEVPNEIPEPIKELESELEEKGVQVPDFDEVTNEDEVFGHSLEEAKKHLSVALDNDVDAVATAMGTPEWVVEKCHDAGVKVISLVGHPKHAVHAENAGADLIIADGTEGGGHSGGISTLTLVPMVDKVVDVPVVAAGGIVHGSQITAALSLGAVGVWCGTLFVPTKESASDPDHKRSILEADIGDPTVRTKAIDGYPLRLIENRVTEVYEGRENEIERYPQQKALTKAITEAAISGDKDEYKTFAAGQGSGLIEDPGNFPQVNYLMAGLLDEMEESYERLSTMVEIE
jgi:NAD(P)H-dependent flavin oxidoreductase YrpB (nitropropane dioxygenase family)